MRYTKALLILLFGMMLTQIPDLIRLYEDHTIDKYADKYCDSKEPNECSFDKYFYHFENDHPTLNKVSNYFLLGEGPLYFVLSRRCTNEIFYNISATKDSGKITNRDYFFSRCSHFNIDMSDLFWGSNEKK